MPGIQQSRPRGGQLCSDPLRETTRLPSVPFFSSKQLRVTADCRPALCRALRLRCPLPCSPDNSGPTTRNTPMDHSTPAVGHTGSDQLHINTPDKLGRTYFHLARAACCRSSEKIRATGAPDLPQTPWARLPGLWRRLQRPQGSSPSANHKAPLLL
jgi:hypothetical protein